MLRQLAYLKSADLVRQISGKISSLFWHVADKEKHQDTPCGKDSDRDDGGDGGILQIDPGTPDNGTACGNGDERGGN